MHWCAFFHEGCDGELQDRRERLARYMAAHMPASKVMLVHDVPEDCIDKVCAQQHGMWDKDNLAIAMPVWWLRQNNPYEKCALRPDPVQMGVKHLAWDDVKDVHTTSDWLEGDTRTVVPVPSGTDMEFDVEQRHLEVDQFRFMLSRMVAQTLNFIVEELPHIAHEWVDALVPTVQRAVHQDAWAKYVTSVRNVITHVTDGVRMHDFERCEKLLLTWWKEDMSGATGHHILHHGGRLRTAETYHEICSHCRWSWDKVSPHVNQDDLCRMLLEGLEAILMDPDDEHAERRLGIWKWLLPAVNLASGMVDGVPVMQLFLNRLMASPKRAESIKACLDCGSATVCMDHAPRTHSIAGSSLNYTRHMRAGQRFDAYRLVQLRKRKQERAEMRPESVDLAKEQREIGGGDGSGAVEVRRYMDRMEDVE